MKTISKKWQQVCFYFVLIFYSFSLTAHEDVVDYLNQQHFLLSKNPFLFHHQHFEGFKYELEGNDSSIPQNYFMTNFLQHYFLTYFQNKSSLISKNIKIGLFQERSSQFSILEDHKKNFIRSTILEINKAIPSALWLVNLRSFRQDPQNRIYDQEYENSSIKYLTPLSSALSYDTVGEYCEHNAILDSWAGYCAIAFVHLPKGTKIRGLVGLSSSQKADSKTVAQDALSLGINPSLLQQSIQGGDVQLLLTKASQAIVYDHESLFKQRFISRLGREGKSPYLNPIKHFPNEGKLKTLHCHLLYKSWRQQPLNLRKFLGLVKRGI